MIPVQEATVLEERGAVGGNVVAFPAFRLGGEDRFGGAGPLNSVVAVSETGAPLAAIPTGVEVPESALEGNDGGVEGIDAIEGFGGAAGKDRGTMIFPDPGDGALGAFGRGRVKSP